MNSPSAQVLFVLCVTAADIVQMSLDSLVLPGSADSAANKQNKPARERTSLPPKSCWVENRFGAQIF